MSNTLNLGNGKWARKKGSLLAYNSENNNYKPLPFTFDRDSVATRVNKQGLIETVGADQPRIDYLNDSNGALLLEPSRTNLITYSEDLSNWTKLFGHTYPVTDNSTDVISPSGLNDASKVEFDNSSQGIALFPSLNGTYSGFVYVKGIAGETIRFNFGGQEQNYTLTGEWDKLERENLSLSVNAFNLNTFGGATARTIYVWGAQIEQGSYATSYIPTQGSAVTRLADSCNNGGNEQVINSTEGVLYFEGSSIANDGTFKRISIGTSDNLFENNLQLRYNTVDNSISYQFRVGNVYQADITITANTTNLNKIACVWKINRFEIWVNGIKEAQDTSGSVPSSNTFNSLFVGKTSTSLAEPFYGDIKDLRVYNTALTDQELIALTQV